MTATKQKDGDAAPVPTVPYQPNEAEKGALSAFAERGRARKPAPNVRFIANGKDKSVFTLDHADKETGQLLLMEALGTAEPAFLEALLAQIVNAGTTGQEPDERAARQLVATVKGIAPRDHVEAMLAAQMAATNALTMTFARRLNLVDTVPQQDSAVNAFNKLARTFAAQADTLKRYRSSGEQTMRVEHVTVQAGGQAIVGTVTRGDGGDGKN
jgi:hypothetical protein